MRLVAIVCRPERPDEAARALAEASGAALAEARMRLAPEPPALLARLAPDRAASLVAALRRAGLAALAVDDHIPTDADRTVARTCSLGEEGLVVAPRSGAALEVAWPEVLAVLRGMRASRIEVERTEKSKRFSLGTAVATGGLLLTRTAQTTQRSSSEATEQVVLVFTRDGRAAVLSEHELNFSCLGPGMQPSSTANVVELARRLRERAKGAFHDDRLLRLGRRPLPFLAGGESRSETGTMVTTRTDTSSSLDTLAEVMRQALMEGLLP